MALDDGLDLRKLDPGVLAHDLARQVGRQRRLAARDFVNELRSMNVTPHIAQNTAGRRSSIDGRTTRHAGFAISQRIRKRIEEAFGWGKDVGPMRRMKVRGRERLDMAFTFTATACNLIRLPKLLADEGVA